MTRASLSGLLFKRSDYLKLWNPRYFVLKDDSLLYFAHSSVSRDMSSFPDPPRRILSLRDAVVSGITHEGTKHVFSVTMAKTGVVYVLAAGSMMEATQWIEALTAAARWKGGMSAGTVLEDRELKEEEEEGKEKLGGDALELYEAARGKGKEWKFFGKDKKVEVWNGEGTWKEEHARSVGLVTVALWIVALLMSAMEEGWKVKILLFFMTMSYFWISRPEIAPQIKSQLLSYSFVCIFTCFVFLPSYLYLLGFCTSLAPFVVGILDEDAAKSTIAYLLALDKSHYRATVRINKSPEFLLRLFSSYSLQIRQFCDTNLIDLTLLERVSKQKSIGRLVYNSSLPGIFSHRELVLEQEWHCLGKSTYIICERSIDYPSSKADDVVRAFWNGGVVISLANDEHDASVSSLVTIVGHLNFNIWSIVGPLVSLLVPVRESKSIFELAANISAVPASLGEELSIECNNNVVRNPIVSRVVDPLKEWEAVGEKINQEMQEFGRGTEKDGWEKIEETHGVTIHKKKLGEKIAVRGSLRIPYAPIYVVDLIGDLSLRSKVDGMFDEGKSVKKLNGSLKVEHLKYKGVWPTAPRDFCVLAYFFIDEQGNFVMAAKSIQHPLVPEVDGYVRGEVFIGGYLIDVVQENPNECDVTYVSYSDPKGSLPLSMVQNVQKSQPMVLHAIAKYLSTLDLAKLDLTAVKEKIASFKADLIDPITLSVAENVSDDSAITDKDKILDSCENPMDVADKAFSSLLELSLLSQDSWNFVSEANDVRVFSRELDGSSVKVIKGEGTVEANAELIYSVVSDPYRRQWYDETCTESRVVESLDESTNLVHNCFEARTIFCRAASRDFVFVARSSQLQNGTCVVASKSVDSELVPPLKNFVRARVLLGGWIIRPSSQNSNRSLVTYIIHLDLGGSVPMWIKKLVMEDQPMCINRLRKLF